MLYLVLRSLASERSNRLKESDHIGLSSLCDSDFYCFDNAFNGIVDDGAVCLCDNTMSSSVIKDDSCVVLCSFFCSFLLISSIVGDVQRTMVSNLITLTLQART